MVISKIISMVLYKSIIFQIEIQQIALWRVWGMCRPRSLIGKGSKFK